ncbi:MAG: tetratricopeptide repeat protein [Acidobacteriota bacterium]|nr:tetratricopeptide repeat protein [Acidobacteriota bacterium]
MRGALLGMVTVLALSSLVACAKIGQLKAMKSFKDANALYQQQEYKRAAALYEDAVANDPTMGQAWFFLANSYDNLYKPSRKGEAENDAYLTKAVAGYQKAADLLPTTDPTDAKLKNLALQYLVASYGPDKLNDPNKALPVIKQMIQLNPADPTNYFKLSQIYEDAGQYDLAEQTLLQAKQVKPDDSSVYLQLAGFYNRQGEFDKTIEALQERIQKEPNNPEAYYTVATYYWDKAYRDASLKNEQKLDYVNKGIDAIDQALKIRPDYMEALVYKNLLLRLEANLIKDPKKQQDLIKQADKLRDQANELRKKKAAGVGE